METINRKTIVNKGKKQNSKPVKGAPGKATGNQKLKAIEKKKTPNVRGRNKVQRYEQRSQTKPRHHHDDEEEEEEEDCAINVRLRDALKSKIAASGKTVDECVALLIKCVQVSKENELSLLDKDNYCLIWPGGEIPGVIKQDSHDAFILDPLNLHARDMRRRVCGGGIIKDPEGRSRQTFDMAFAMYKDRIEVEKEESERVATAFLNATVSAAEWAISGNITPTHEAVASKLRMLVKADPSIKGIALLPSEINRLYDESTREVRKTVNQFQLDKARNGYEDELSEELIELNRTSLNWSSALYRGVSTGDTRGIKVLKSKLIRDHPTMLLGGVVFGLGSGCWLTFAMFRSVWRYFVPVKKFVPTGVSQADRDLVLRGIESGAIKCLSVREEVRTVAERVIESTGSFWSWGLTHLATFSKRAALISSDFLGGGVGGDHDDLYIIKDTASALAAGKVAAKVSDLSETPRKTTMMVIENLRNCVAATTKTASTLIVGQLKVAYKGVKAFDFEDPKSVYSQSRTWVETLCTGLEPSGCAVSYEGKTYYLSFEDLEDLRNLESRNKWRTYIVSGVLVGLGSYILYKLIFRKRRGSNRVSKQ